LIVITNRDSVLPQGDRKGEGSMKIVYAAAAAAMLFAAAPAQAQVVDLSTITCADFSGRPNDQMANIMFWLEGYYTEDEDPTIVDFDKFKSTLEQILIYCSNHPTIGLLTAADEVMGKDSDEGK
jgi:acid stress chaperone HdeB